MSWSEATVEELQRLHRVEAVPWIEQRTVVVGEYCGGDPAPNFTGVLLQVADRHFVITAAHCLKGWGKSRFWILLPEGDVIDLTTVQAETPTDRSMDFALLPLTDEMVTKLSGFRSFVRLSEVDVLGDLPRPGIHAVLGYPLQQRERLEGGWISKAIFYPTALTTIEDQDPNTTIALFRDVEHTDENGERSPLPELKGISGCGIWRLHTKGDDPPTWTVDRIRLVGIEHSVPKRARSSAHERVT